MNVLRFLYVVSSMTALSISRDDSYESYGRLLSQLSGMTMQRHLARDFPLSRRGVPQSHGYYYVDLTKEYRKQPDDYTIQTIRKGKPILFFCSIFKLINIYNQFSAFRHHRCL